MTSMDTLGKKVDKLQEEQTTMRIMIEQGNGDTRVLINQIENLTTAVNGMRDTMKDRGKDLDETMIEVAVIKDNVGDMKTKLKTESRIWDGINTLAVIVGTWLGIK